MNIGITPAGGSAVYLDWIPEEIKVRMDGKFLTYNIISLGEVQIPRGSAPVEVSWNAKFPGAIRKNEIGVKADHFRKPTEMVKMFRTWRDNGTRLNIRCTEIGINLDMYISKFDGSYSGGAFDFDYSVTFVEARKIVIKTTEASTGSGRSESERSNEAESKQTMVHTVGGNDTLWRIAQQYLGDGRRWDEIYELNKNVIEAEARKYGNASSREGDLIYDGTKLTIPAK